MSEGVFSSFISIFALKLQQSVFHKDRSCSSALEILQYPHNFRCSEVSYLTIDKSHMHVLKPEVIKQ